jgi:DNA-binding XRE family transcriptional regulator
MNALVQRLISARKAAGISQAVAAEHLNISRPTFIAIEKGARDAKPEEVRSLAKLYNTSVSRLMRHNSPPTQVAPHLRAVIEREGENSGLELAVAKLVEFVDDYM